MRVGWVTLIGCGSHPVDWQRHQQQRFASHWIAVARQHSTVVFFDGIGKGADISRCVRGLSGRQTF
jgi:hypothetical protein